jgi:hypothetical protein
LGREWRRPSLQLLAFLVVALWLPTLVWPGDRTVWPLLRGFLPGLDALRAISRMGLLLLIPASLAIGLFVHGRERSHRPLAFLAIGAVCLLEQGTSVPSYPREPYEWIVEEIVDEIDPNAEAFFYVGAGGSPHWYSQIDALLASQRTGVPTINMYSGQYPSVFLKLLQNVARSPQEMQRIRARLDRWIAENDLDPERVQLIDQHALLEIRSRRVERYGTPDPVAARKAKAGPSSDP